MNKLLNKHKWCVSALIGSGLGLFFAAQYVLKWLNADPRYFDLIATAFIMVITGLVFLAAVYTIGRMLWNEVSTYAQLLLPKVSFQLPQVSVERTARK